MPAKNDLETWIYFLEEFGVFLPQTRTTQKQNLGKERQRKKMACKYALYLDNYIHIYVYIYVIAFWMVTFMTLKVRAA